MTDPQMQKMNAVAVVPWTSKLSILSCVCICMDECLIGSDEVEGCAVGSGQGIQGETGELSSIIHGLFQFASSEAGPGQGA